MIKIPPPNQMLQGFWVVAILVALHREQKGKEVIDSLVILNPVSQ